MYILDTDHLSVIDRGGEQAKGLLQRLASIDPTQVATSIISYEEQMRGWLSYIAKAQTLEKQVEACIIPVVEFDDRAAQEFQRIKKLYPRLGTMDLKIASIVLVNRAVLLTRNSSDFGCIADLPVESWI
jgi:tRNA(fMet)-specific endonuclease VapC